MLNCCWMVDGDIFEVNGYVKMVFGSNNVKLRVIFFWFFYGDYWIFVFDFDYSVVFVGEFLCKLVWVFVWSFELLVVWLVGLFDCV